jgi:glycosyltransferase involved in cell wall biosynthesis
MKVRLGPPYQVLYICPNSALAGAEQVTYLILKHHNKSLWEPHIYFLQGSGSMVEAVKSLKVPYYLNSQRKSPLRLRNPFSVMREIQEISNLIKEKQISIIHSVMGYGHIFGGVAARKCGIPSVWFQHGPVGSLDKWVSKIPSEMILVNSTYTLEQEKKVSPNTGKYQIIPLGTERLSESEWKQDSARFKTQFTAGTLIFGLVGRIAPLKGHSLFIDAAAQLIQNSPPGFHLGFMIIGDTFSPGDEEYKSQIQMQIQKRGLEKFFHFTGHLSPPYGAMAACDVIVNASIHPEGFGMTLIEAMMLGKPVIGPQVGGPVEYIQPKINGFFFEPGQKTSLSNAMMEFVKAPTICAQLGQQGKATAINRFSAERMTQEVEAGYLDLIRSS